VSPEGDESFGNLQPHPETAGIYGTNGTVADYLHAQGLAPYFAMGDRYGVLYDRMVALIERIDPEDDPERRYERRLAMDELDVGTLATSWFDVDATVEAYCRERALAIPTDVDALVDLHLKAVGTWLDALEAQLKDQNP